MLEISRKWGMLALALATGAALAAPVALRPTQAYVDDGIEVVQEGEQGQVERGRGSFDDTPVVSYVAADGTKGSASSIEWYARPQKGPHHEVQQARPDRLARRRLRYELRQYLLSA